MSDQPRAPKNKTKSNRTHWYNPAVPMAHKFETPPEPRIGKARERTMRRQADQQLPQVDWTWVVIGAAVVGIIGVVILVVLATSGQQSQATLNTGGEGVGGATASPEFVPVVAPTVEIKPWDGKSRVTILVMGLDKRPGEQGRSYRTDTLILVSLDPATQRVGMLSIPRDLVVPIPNYAEMQPINTAFVYGELARPGYGPRLAAETVQYNFGMRIDHYVVVQFEAVIHLIDAIGGITVEVPKPIDDKEFPDLYTYGYDPLYIPAGIHQMDGLLALKYARTRHGDSDFDRTGRQQQVLMAIRKKVLRADMLPQLLGQAGAIWNEISQGVETDLTFEQILSLGWYAKDIPDENIKRGAVTGDYVQVIPFRGTNVLTVNRSTVANLLIEVFGQNYSQ